MRCEAARNQPGVDAQAQIFTSITHTSRRQRNERKITFAVYVTTAYRDRDDLGDDPTQWKAKPKSSSTPTPDRLRDEREVLKQR